MEPVGAPVPDDSIERESAREIDHEFTDEIVCPHCGHEHGDSWEWRGDDGEADCDDCGKPFEWSRNVSVCYSTKAKP